MRFAPMTSDDGVAVRPPGIARLQRKELVSVNFKVVTARQPSIVSEGELKDGGRVCGGDVSVFLTEVILTITVIGRVEQHLQAVVPGSCRRGPWDSQEARLSGTAFHADVYGSTADRDWLVADAEIKEGQIHRHRDHR